MTTYRQRQAMHRRVGRGFWSNAYQISRMEPDHDDGNTVATNKPGAYPVAQHAQKAGQADSQMPGSLSMTTPQSDPLPDIPENIRSALALVTDAVSRGAWRQIVDRARMLSDAAQNEWAKDIQRKRQIERMEIV